MSCTNWGHCCQLPVDCDIIGSEIFDLLDQYHDLYTKVYMNWDREDSTTSSSSSDEENSETEIKSEDIRNEDVIENTADTTNPAKTDAETAEIVPEKRVHFDVEPKDMSKDLKEQTSNEDKPDDKVIIRNQELDIEVIKDKIKDRQKELENEFKNNVRLYKSMQKKIEQMETVSRRYETQMDKHYKAIVKMNMYADLLCQRIADYLNRLKCLEKLYNKSVRKLKLDLMRLLPKQRELKRNEYRIIAVRNLEFKVETTERNIRRLKKAIDNEKVLIQEWEFLLNPMSLQ